MRSVAAPAAIAAAAGFAIAKLAELAGWSTGVADALATAALALIIAVTLLRSAEYRGKGLPSSPARR